MKLKRAAYIGLFILLGSIVQIFVHAGIEILILKMLMAPGSLSLAGASGRAWLWIHHVLSVLLLIAGAGLGYSCGVRWWPRLYDESGRIRPWKGKC